MHADGVYSQDAAGTGTVVLKVVRVMGSAFSGFTMDKLLHTRLFFSHTHHWDVVDVCHRESLLGGRDI